MTVARNAAHQAGGIIMDRFLKLEKIEKKGAVDLVTEADKLSEEAIVGMIKSAFPDDNIIAEEGDYQPGDPVAPRWIIDPLDGTTNYVHGLPIFAISIGYQVNRETMLGIVYNPASGEEFGAIRGQGATLNGTPIGVSNCSDLAEALLATGFPYQHDDTFFKSFDLFGEFYSRCQGIRRMGAAAIDLCYVAAGRFDGFYEANLQPWDVCAGDLICREAGGKTSDWDNAPMPFTGNRVLASNGLIHSQMLNILAAYGPGN